MALVWCNRSSPPRVAGMSWVHISGVSLSPGAQHDPRRSTDVGQRNNRFTSAAAVFADRRVELEFRETRSAASVPAAGTAIHSGSSARLTAAVVAPEDFGFEFGHLPDGADAVHADVWSS